MPAALLLTVACGTSGAGMDHVEVRVGALAIDAEIARTVDERALGLGGRDEMARDAGMLFVYREEQVPGFWMHGMRFPLDFVWISSAGRVVDLTENVPRPSAGTPDTELDFYRPGAPVQFVLEVNAGVVSENGIEIGDEVNFDPQPNTGSAS